MVNILLDRHVEKFYIWYYICQAEIPSYCNVIGLLQPSNKLE